MLTGTQWNVSLYTVLHGVVSFHITCRITLSWTGNCLIWAKHMQKAYFEWKESRTALVFTRTVSAGSECVPQFVGWLYSKWLEGECGKKGSFKPGSQILQCGIVQAIKGIFRTACVIAELLQCIKRLPCRKEGRQMGEDGGQAAGIIRSKAWEFQMWFPLHVLLI